MIIPTGADRKPFRGYQKAQPGRRPGGTGPRVHPRGGFFSPHTYINEILDAAYRSPEQRPHAPQHGLHPGEQDQNPGGRSGLWFVNQGVNYQIHVQEVYYVSKKKSGCPVRLGAVFCYPFLLPGKGRKSKRTPRAQRNAASRR